MRHWVAETKLNSERLAGQKEAIELVLSSKGWMSRLQCYAGTHKMLVLHPSLPTLMRHLHPLELL